MQREWSEAHTRDTNWGSRLDTNGFMSWECTEMQADKRTLPFKKQVRKGVAVKQQFQQQRRTFYV